MFLGFAVRDGVLTNYFSSSKDEVLSVPSSRKWALDNEEGNVYGYLRNEVDPDAVIVADNIIGFYIAGLTGRPVVSVRGTHSPLRPEALDGRVRRKGTKQVMHGLNVEKALQVIDVYDVRYVVASTSAKSGKPWLGEPIWSLGESNPDLFAKIYADDDSAVYEVLAQSDVYRFFRLHSCSRRPSLCPPWDNVTATEGPDDTASPLPAIPTATPQITNRWSCSAIRGTSYLSEEEHQWFQANCVVPKPPP